MARTKRNLFAMLGWVVWKLLSLLGVKYAQDKLAASGSDRRLSRH